MITDRPARISDLHLDGSDRNTERAERVMSYVNGLPTLPDAVLIIGDIAYHSLPEEYEQARKILSSPHPVLTCPGSHDRRRAYAQVLLGQAGGDAPINAVHWLGGAMFVLCDSTIAGRDDGYLADETLGWLESVLTDASEDTAVFVCFHHPPATLHSPFIDKIRQRGEQRLADLVARHPQVVAILCGHAHTAAATTFAGRPLPVAPGATSTLRLPWEHRHVLDDLLPRRWPSTSSTMACGSPRTTGSSRDRVDALAS